MAISKSRWVRPAARSYVAEALVGMLADNLTPQEAASEPHFANPNGPTLLEKDTPITALKPKLEAMGHHVIPIHMKSGLYIVEKTANGYVGGADPRRDGVAMGD